MIQNGPSQKSPPILPPQNVGTLLHMNFLSIAENFRSYITFSPTQNIYVKLGPSYREFPKSKLF